MPYLVLFMVLIRCSMITASSREAEGWVSKNKKTFNNETWYQIPRDIQHTASLPYQAVSLLHSS